MSYTEHFTLVDASTASTGDVNAAVGSLFRAAGEAFLQIEMSAAASVTLYSRLHPGLSWVQISPSAYTANDLELYPMPAYLRVVWTGNTGTLSVVLWSKR